MAPGPVEAFLLRKMEQNIITNSLLIARERNPDDSIRHWLVTFSMEFDGHIQDITNSWYERQFETCWEALDNFTTVVNQIFGECDTYLHGTEIQRRLEVWDQIHFNEFIEASNALHETARELLAVVFFHYASI